MTLIIGLPLLGAAGLAAYVFTLAARRYVSGDDKPAADSLAEHPADEPGQKAPGSYPGDRRRGRPAAFPMTVNGIVIEADRRQQT